MAKRKYKCIGLKEKESTNWSDKFEVGGVYNRKEIDHIDIDSLCMEPHGAVWVGIGLYVDEDQFELVEDEK
jgi:hypothetical protein